MVCFYISFCSHAHSYYILQPPFVGGNRDKVQQKIVKEKIKLPAYLSSEVHSLLKGVSCLPSLWFTAPIFFCSLVLISRVNLFDLGIEFLVHLMFQLLHKEAGRRLGCGPGGSNEIKNHKWFKSVNWKKLDSRQIQPSFRPNVAGKTCIANFDECWTSMPVLDSPVASPVAADSNFVGFSYVRPAPFLQRPSPLGWRPPVETEIHLATGYEADKIYCFDDYYVKLPIYVVRFVWENPSIFSSLKILVKDERGTCWNQTNLSIARWNSYPGFYDQPLPPGPWAPGTFRFSRPFTYMFPNPNPAACCNTNPVEMQI